MLPYFQGLKNTESWVPKNLICLQKPENFINCFGYLDYKCSFPEKEYDFLYKN